MGKKIGIVFMLVLMVVSACGCQFGQLVNPVDPSKKEIVISVYDGGLGTAWIDPVVADFEADYPEYRVSLERKKRTIAEIQQLIALGSQADAYISTVSDFHTDIYKDNMVDLSDILEMKVDGETKTIGEKFPQKDFWKKIASKDGQGLYMLPYDDCVLGFNYDHEKFLQYGLLIEAENTELVKTALTAQGITFTVVGDRLIFQSATSATNYNAGDTILRAGKDETYGTYDDGQPISMQEWDRMFNLLKGIGKAVIFSGKNVDYLTDVFNGVFAQYDGMDAWETFSDYDGNYTFKGDSAPTKITLDNGYRVFAMEGIHKATEFMQTYLNNHDYVHESGYMTEESHTDAQGKFVIGSAKTSVTSPFTGFLADGIWWENEARKIIFDELSSGSKPMLDYAYGKRDYRIMLYPNMPGQKGADGEGNGSVLSARSTGAMVVPKNNDADILEKTKLFLAYTLKDEHLRNFTVVTGAPRPYDYNLKADDLAKMTKFARNNWELYRDREHVEIVRPMVDRYLTALPYKTSKGYNVNWYSRVGSVNYNMPWNALRAAENSMTPSISADPVKAVFEGFESYFKPAWASYVSELNR